MRLTSSIVVLTILLSCGHASAQFSNGVYYEPTAPFGPTSTNVRPGDTQVPVFVTGGPCVPTSTGCLTFPLFIPLSNFAAAGAPGQGQIDSLSSRLDTLNGQIGKALEIGAIASAMKDAIPNSGDRFAIRLNAAAFNGQGAGAIGFSYNLTDSARVSVNYGQGRSQGVVSGGMNFSFR